MANSGTMYVSFIPPMTPMHGVKNPCYTEKHQNIDDEENGNHGHFHSSVTLTKRFGCFWDTLGRVKLKGLPGTQLGGEMPYSGNNGQKVGFTP